MGEKYINISPWKIEQNTKINNGNRNDKKNLKIPDLFIYIV